MKITLFDIGAFVGDVTDYFVKMFKELNIDYEVYQFEPYPPYVETLKSKAKNDSKIHVFQAAVSDNDGTTPLYMADIPAGHSLYSTKWNVDPNKSIDVDAICFSSWYKKNFQRKKQADDFYIFKSNANGSEWDIFNDLIVSKLNSQMDVFCGKIFDNLKANKTGAHTDKESKDFIAYLKKNGIDEIYLTGVNIDNLNVIRQKILDFKQNLPKTNVAEQPSGPLEQIVLSHQPPEPIVKEPRPKVRKQRPIDGKTKEIER